MIERRDFIRFNAALKAICEIGRGIKRTYEVKNISKSGALIVLDTPLDNGSEINVSLDVPGDNVPIFVSGTVAWQRKSILEPKKSAYETGIRFAVIDGFDKSRLLDYIYSLWLKLSERK
ncbi:MAG: PilZ domain-containing protein [Candidatus Omnitrophota bacterium]|nr:PilZ domain-containing protein [Candidatus Omnitrophota bacterium]